MNKNIINKKILFLGASIYFLDAAKYAKELGLYLIAVDKNDGEKAIVKNIADEAYTINTTDIEKLYKLALDKNIAGIYAGASEVNIPIAIELSKKLNLPYYTDFMQWEMCTNKGIFKQKCIENDIKVSRVYSSIDDNSITYPVVCKPVDNNGSTGISICFNKKELEFGYKKALDNSKSKWVLIEEYIPSDSVIIQYTLQDGVVKYSGMSDKKSKKIKPDAAPVMAIQFFPSIHEQQYLKEVDFKAQIMLKNAGMRYGAVWIEAFYYNNQFIFNEIGYRFGGSLTYYPVEYFYNINQVKILLYQCLTGSSYYDDFQQIEPIKSNKKYSILPIQIRPCIIKKIIGLDKINSMDNVYKFVQSHVLGDRIEDTGTTHQVFGYLHLVGNSIVEIKKAISEVKKNLIVEDELGNNVLFTIWEEGND